MVGCFKRRYKRAVNRVYPRVPEEELDRDALQHLSWYALANARKLPRIARYLNKKIASAQRHNNRHLVTVGLDIYDTLLERCHNEINLFLQRYLEVVRDLLSTNSAFKAVESFEKFTRLSTSSSIFERMCPEFIDHFSSLAFYRESRSTEMREAGVTGLLAIVRKDEGNKRTPVIYERNSLQKAIPAILSNLTMAEPREARPVVMEKSEGVLRELCERANITTMVSILRPTFRFLSSFRLWSEQQQRAAKIVNIVLESVNSTLIHMIADELVVHLNETAELNALAKKTIVESICTIVESVSHIPYTNIINIFHSLLNHLRTSNSGDEETKALQTTIISAFEKISATLSNENIAEALVIVLGKLRTTDIMYQRVLLMQCATAITPRYEVTGLHTSFSSALQHSLFQALIDPSKDVRAEGLQVLHHVLHCPLEQKRVEVVTVTRSTEESTDSTIPEGTDGSAPSDEIREKQSSSKDSRLKQLTTTVIRTMSSMVSLSTAMGMSSAGNDAQGKGKAALPLATSTNIDGTVKEVQECFVLQAKPIDIAFVEGLMHQLQWHFYEVLIKSNSATDAALPLLLREVVHLATHFGVDAMLAVISLVLSMQESGQKAVRVAFAAVFFQKLAEALSIPSLAQYIEDFVVNRAPVHEDAVALGGTFPPLEKTGEYFSSLESAKITKCLADAGYADLRFSIPYHHAAAPAAVSPVHLLRAQRESAERSTAQGAATDGVVDAEGGNQAQRGVRVSVSDADKASYDGAHNASRLLSTASTHGHQSAISGLGSRFGSTRIGIHIDDSTDSINTVGGGHQQQQHRGKASSTVTATTTTTTSPATATAAHHRTSVEHRISQDDASRRQGEAGGDDDDDVFADEGISFTALSTRPDREPSINDISVLADVPDVDDVVALLDAIDAEEAKTHVVRGQRSRLPSISVQSSHSSLSPSSSKSASPTPSMLRADVDANGAIVAGKNEQHGEPPACSMLHSAWQPIYYTTYTI